MDENTVYESALQLFMDPAIRDRTFYPRFRMQWIALFEKAMQEEAYFSENARDIIEMKRTIGEQEYVFHLSQNKMAEWFARESTRRRKIVFIAKKFSRGYDHVIRYEDAVCTYDPSLPEETLDDANRNIFACAKPGFPLELQIIYGNKWVNSRFNVFHQRSLHLFWIQTDYVPAFLASPFEVCLYLFLMDICIIREDTHAVKDEELENLLHIFRPSPMLRVKKLIDE